MDVRADENKRERFDMTMILLLKRVLFYLDQFVYISTPRLQIERIVLGYPGSRRIIEFGHRRVFSIGVMLIGNIIACSIDAAKR